MGAFLYFLLECLVFGAIFLVLGSITLLGALTGGVALLRVGARVLDAVIPTVLLFFGFGFEVCDIAGALETFLANTAERVLTFLETDTTPLKQPDVPAISLDGFIAHETLQRMNQQTQIAYLGQRRMMEASEQYLDSVRELIGDSQ